MGDNCEHGWAKINAVSCPRCRDATELARLRSALEAAERGQRDALHDLGIELGARREAEARAEAAERERDDLKIIVVPSLGERLTSAEAAVERLTREAKLRDDGADDETAEKIAGLTADLAAARAEVERLTRERNEARRFMLSAEKAYCGSAIMLEVMGFFDAAGCGQPGTPNTLWSMTQEIIASRDAARAEAGALREGIEREAVLVAPLGSASGEPRWEPAQRLRALAAGGKHGG